VSATLDIQSRKIALLEAFLNLQNEEILGQLEVLIRTDELTLRKTSLQPMSLQSFEERINASLEDAANDNVISSAALISELEEWG
jgi:hypothetical protein